MVSPEQNTNLKTKIFKCKLLYHTDDDDFLPRSEYAKKRKNNSNRKMLEEGKYDAIIGADEEGWVKLELLQHH